MGFDVAFPDSLEKYGIVGALVFAAVAAGGAALWSSIIKAVEAYQGSRRKKRLRAVIMRPLATSLLFFVPFVMAIIIVASTKRELRHAASLVDGNWSIPVQACHLQIVFWIDPDLGRLTIQTADRFRFIYEIDAIGDTFVQAHPRGSSMPSLFERRGDRLVEVLLSGQTRELIRC